MKWNRCLNVWCLLTVFFPKQSMPEELYNIEYGSVFRQQVFPTSSKMEKLEYKNLIEWTRKYVEQRAAWACPWLLERHGKQPEVTNMSKTYLIYTHDDWYPLHFDSYVFDKNGNKHGVSRIIIFGSLFRFVLYWRRNQLQFVHNFTVSLYPEDMFNIYTHTFYIQNINLTLSNTQSKYLLPKFDKNRLKESGTRSQKISDLDEYLELNFDDIGNFHKHIDSNRYGFNDKSAQTCESELDCDSSNVEYRYSKFHQDHLSVMSYNIWNMNAYDSSPKGYTKRMRGLKQTILKANPDIIALQEVRYEELKGGDLGPNQMHTLADWFKDYQFVFQPAQMQPNSLSDGRTEEGVAIMSKYPIIFHNYKLLFIFIFAGFMPHCHPAKFVQYPVLDRNRSNSADTHQRILLHAEIVVPFIGKIHVINTHLSLSHEAREKSVVQICSYISKLEGPVILLGDMNAEPNEPAMKYLSGQDLLPGVTKRCQLKDIWLETNSDNSGLTYNSLDEVLNKRIDYMLYSGWHSCCKVDTIKVIDDGKRGVHAASDHCPVMVTFSFHSIETKF